MLLHLNKSLRKKVACNLHTKGIFPTPFISCNFNVGFEDAEIMITIHTSVSAETGLLSHVCVISSAINRTLCVSECAY